MTFHDKFFFIWHYIINFCLNFFSRDISWFDLIWFISYIDLTSIWDRFMRKNYKNYQKIEWKKILRSNSEIKNLFNKQKQCDVMTSFHYFNTNESYNPYSHKKNKIKSKKWNQIHQHWVFICQRFVFIKCSIKDIHKHFDQFF